MLTMTKEEFNAKGRELYGELGRFWLFKCPNCGKHQRGQDFLDAGISEEEARRLTGFSCIGRVKPSLGCNWTLGGLFKIHKMEVVCPDGESVPHFEFVEHGEIEVEKQKMFGDEPSAEPGGEVE